MALLADFDQSRATGAHFFQKSNFRDIFSDFQRRITENYTFVNSIRKLLLNVQPDVSFLFHNWRKIIEYYHRISSKLACQA